MSIELSKQKLQIDEAARDIHQHILRLQEAERVLLNGIKNLDMGEDMLNSGSILAGEVRMIMRQMAQRELVP